MALWSVRWICQPLDRQLRARRLVADLKFDAAHGIIKEAHLDTAEVEDQGWGFEVLEFTAQGSVPAGT